jgi:hypothetical protein
MRSPYSAVVLAETLLVSIARSITAAVRVTSDWRRRRRQGPAERLRAALAIKREVAEHFPQVLPPQTNGDAIIRELRRKDTYPELDDSLRGISPWFKVELMGIYFRGVEVVLSVQNVVVIDGVARPAAASDGPDGRNVFVVGRIPYTAIEAIDWEGDEFYGFTHIYCHYRGWTGRKGPYEALCLHNTQPQSLGGSHRYYERLEGVRWAPGRYGLMRRWQSRRLIRRMEREMRTRRE